MCRATELCKIEMSMLGLLSVHPLGLVLEELFIPPQIVGASHTQIEASDIGNIQTSLLNRGVIKPGATDKFLRFAWHSHVDMKATMSVPDRQTFTSLGGNGTALDPAWYISMVMNRQEEYEVIYDQWQPVRAVIDITDKTIIGDPTFADSALLGRIRQFVKLGRQTIVGGKHV